MACELHFFNCFFTLVVCETFLSANQNNVRVLNQNIL